MAKSKVTKEIKDEEELRKEEEEDEEEDDEDLPFPNAVVVRIMRNNLPEGALIRKRVKVEMNKLLGEICRDVAKEMGKVPYAYIDYTAFKNAAKKYLEVEHVEKDKERIILTLRKLGADIDAIIRDLERKEY